MGLMTAIMHPIYSMDLIGLDMMMRHPVNSRENLSISWTLVEHLFGPLTLMNSEEIMEKNSLCCMPSMRVWNLVKRLILRIPIVREQLQCAILLNPLPQHQQQLLILDPMNAQKTLMSFLTQEIATNITCAFQRKMEMVMILKNSLAVIGYLILTLMLAQTQIFHQMIYCVLVFKPLY